MIQMHVYTKIQKIIKYITYFFTDKTVINIVNLI